MLTAKPTFKWIPFTFLHLQVEVVNSGRHYLRLTHKVPISRQVDKNAVAYVHNGILPCHKKKEILPFVAAWMDLESMMLHEIKIKTVT